MPSFRTGGARVFRDSVTGRIILQWEDERGKVITRSSLGDDAARRLASQIQSLLRPAIVDPRYDPRLPMRRF